MTENIKNKNIVELNEIHNDLKNSPYWFSFDHSLYISDILPKMRKALLIISDLSYIDNKTRIDAPFFALFHGLYHDFNHLLTYLRYEKNVEKTDNFQNYYIISLQNFIQLVHYFIEGYIDDPENLIMLLPNKAEDPTYICKLQPVYHDKWENENGVFYYGKEKWHAVRVIKKSEINRVIKELTDIIKKYRKHGEEPGKKVIKAFENIIKDIEDKTSFVYKIV